MTKFQHYLKRDGVAEQIAALCGVTPRAVLSWRQGDRRPRPEMAPKIINHFAGDLTWADIYPPKENRAA